MKPRLLDLFCGAGGAAMGYHRAGFDVVGVDINPQPHYPFEFVQADLTGLLTGESDDFIGWCIDDYDAIHASPPCQDHSRSYTPHTHGTGWMLAATRHRLEDQVAPWVIENVPGANMRVDLKLCGCMFGLPHLRRERWFETSWHAFDLRQSCNHRGGVISVTGHAGAKSGMMTATAEDWRRSMGIDWMTAPELAQAIPPAYTEYIGAQLLDHLRVTS